MKTFNLLTLTKDKIQLILSREISNKEFEKYNKTVLLTKNKTKKIKDPNEHYQKNISLIHISKS